LLGGRVRFQRPRWATQLLGPLPTSRAGEAAWISAAGAIAAYRERWQNLDEDPQGVTVAQSRHLRRVQGALDTLRHIAPIVASANRTWVPAAGDTSGPARHGLGRVP
jgi:hypothetical protein